MAPADEITVSSAEDWTATGGFHWAPSTNASVSNIVTTSRSRGVASESAWVKRTYCMVKEGDQTQPNVISWSDDGEVFEIKDVNALKKDLFPRYHGDTKFESFTRRLRRYGFHRVKSEPLHKTAMVGQGSSFVLAFRHENFQRDRPDLLANLSIISHQNDTPKELGEKLTLNNALSRLEKSQEDLKRTLKEFQDHRLEQKSRIDHLRKETISKDETIRSLEFRMERLENSLLMAMGSSNSKAMPPAPCLFSNVKAGTSSNSTLAEQQFAFLPSQPLKGPGEREVSAVGLLPLLEDWQDPTLLDDEPTLPRSKKMKLFRDGTSSSFDSMTLLRQTTPIFLGIPLF